jgi:hypothetical protein
MLKRCLWCFIFGSCVILLASCSTKTEPNEDGGKDAPVVKGAPAPNESPPGKPDPREVTVHVDGMTERLGLV